MPLRRAKARETQLVLVVDTLGHIEEIAVSAVTRALDITITPGLRTEHRDSPAALAQTRAHRESHLVAVVISERVHQRSAFLGIDTFGDDVNRTADGRRRQFGSTHTALGLHHTCHVRQTLPVGPIDRTAFHVVHRHTVDHRSYVRVVKTAHPDLRVTPTATLAVGMHTRSVLENLRKLLTAKTLIDIERRHLTHRYRRLLVTGDLTRDRDVLQRHRLGIHHDDSKITTTRDTHLDGVVTDVGQLQLRAVRHLDREVSVEVRDDTVGGTNLQNRHTDKRLVGLGIQHGTCHLQRLSTQT